MEKKTIGKLIAALRRANGMTQKELGEKLCVSDKTVSRWECDECTPELSLIPTIAEIFGVTTDELLRGERRNPDRVDPAPQETENRQKTKSDKQFRLMLDSQKRKYKNRTLISASIVLLGFIAAMIANLAYTEGMIAFFIVLGCCLISEVCQLIFANSAKILVDEEDDTYTERINQFNSDVVETVVKISFLNIFLFAFCLPLVTLIRGKNIGLNFETWGGYGTTYILMILPLSYILYTLFVKKALQRRGLLILTDGQIANMKLLKKVTAIALCIALPLCIGIFVFNCIVTPTRWHYVEETFYDWADFKAYVENDFDRWCIGELVPPGGSVVTPIIPSDEDEKLYEEFKVTQTICDSNGEVLCEFYYYPELYREIRFSENADDKLPVTIVTHVRVFEEKVDWGIPLYAFLVADLVTAAVVYFVKARKNT